MKHSAITLDMIVQSIGMLSPEWEHGTRGPYQMFNSGGVEIEVGEFLYGLVRMLKPKRILETGTHKGISSSYMAKALRDNWMFGGDESARPGGFLDTLEIFEENKRDAIQLWSQLGLTPGWVGCVQVESLKYQADEEYDLVLLDSEPQLRFNEFEYYWHHMKPGCVIIIHDLHPHLGHLEVQNPDHPNEPDWPYGDVRKTFLGACIRHHDVSVMSFPTPRGITMFQKARSDFLFTKMAKGLE